MMEKPSTEQNPSDKYPCPVIDCSASYTRRHNLKAHFRKYHRNLEKDYPQVFVTLKSTKEGKLWKCPVDNCSCGYSRKGDLKYHFVRKHAELATLYPDICKSKSSKNNKKHLCPIPECQCGYLRKADLKAHFFAKHPDHIHQHPLLKPRDAIVPCRYCTESFDSGETYSHHLKSVHNEYIQTSNEYATNKTRTTTTTTIQEDVNERSNSYMNSKASSSYDESMEEQSVPLIITNIPIQQNNNIINTNTTDEDESSPKKMQISFILN